MTPALKQRIQDVAVGAVAGALAVGLTIWRDVYILKVQIADVQKDLATVAEFFQNAYPGYSLLIPPPVPSPAPSREP